MESPGNFGLKVDTENHSTIRAAKNITLTDEGALWTIQEEKRKKDAQANLALLRFIQFSFCLFMLGWYARMAPTTINAFYPKAFHFNDDDEFDYLICTAILVPIVTLICITIDFLYFHVLTQRDLWDLKQKQEEYKAAKMEQQEALRRKEDKQQRDRITAQESEEILTEVIDQTNENLNRNKEKIIEILEEDIFIRQLMIQCEIHQKDLIETYRRAGEEANIIELIRRFSENVSLKDYKNSHEQYQRNARHIEYVQALKIPMRFSSIILLSRAIGLDNYPNILNTKEIPDYLQWIIVGGVILWGITAYTYRLEFKKNDTNTEYDKDIRKIRNTHHNALLSTLLLSLNRKVKNEEGITRTQERHTEELFCGFKFSYVIWAKIITSLLCLGPLARRPLTLFALSGAKTSFEAQIIVGAFVLIGILIDFYYLRLSLTEESWNLKNQSDKEFISRECKTVEKNSPNKLPDDFSLTSEEEKRILKNLNFTRTERKLFKELKYNDIAATTPSFRDENKKLSAFKDIIDRSLPLKFGLRALSLGFSLPKLIGWKPDSLGSLPGDNAVMIFAAMIGALIGFMIQAMNRESDSRVRPSSEDPKHKVEYTQNMLLFFVDPLTPAKPRPPHPPTARLVT